VKRSPLTRRTPLRAKPKATKRRPVSAASPQQRAKIRESVSIVSAEGPCDGAHLVSRAQGGCDHPDCVIPLTRAEHRAFDLGELDILPYLIAQNCWVELAHAVLEHHYDPISLVERCTGERWSPVGSVAA
jgi:hypothetical protein